MSDMIYTQEYTDEPTGIRMTVERDGSRAQRITLFPPEPCTLELEEINGALRRLLDISAVVIFEYHQLDPLEEEKEGHERA